MWNDIKIILVSLGSEDFMIALYLFDNEFEGILNGRNGIKADENTSEVVSHV